MKFLHIFYPTHGEEFKKYVFSPERLQPYLSLKNHDKDGEEFIVQARARQVVGTEAAAGARLAAEAENAWIARLAEPAEEAKIEDEEQHPCLEHSFGLSVCY